jgi:DNA-binding transcriptional LysR family regulator
MLDHDRHLLPFAEPLPPWSYELPVLDLSVSFAADMSDRLETIAIFVAVAEQESFAEAARRLGRTPASVTRAVAALELQLQTRLFNRNTRSVSLTAEGARCLDVCRRLLAAHKELQGLDIGPDVPPHGVLRLTAPAIFGQLHVLPAIVTFLDRFPLVDIRADLLDRVVSLVDEGLDVGVRLGELPDSSLRAVRAGYVHMAVYGSPDYLAKRGEPTSPRELHRHNTISCVGMTPIPDLWSFEGVMGIDGVSIKPRLIVNTAAAAADAAAAGLGLTFLVSYQVDAHVRAGRLREILTDYIPPRIPIHIVHPAGSFVPAKVRMFVDHVAEDLRRKFGPA